MKYGELNLGQIEAIVNKLGGMDGIKRLLADELVIKEVERQLKVFKILKLGTGLKNADDFRTSLAGNGLKIGDWANDILGKPAFSSATQETEVDLVVVSVAELGFKNGATREQIYARAKELGLALCPPEVGPQLRLQYNDQPMGEWLAIAMEPIADSGGGLRLFGVKRAGNGQWLAGYGENPGNVWFGSNRFLFVLPRKYQK